MNRACFVRDQGGPGQGEVSVQREKLKASDQTPLRKDRLVEFSSNEQGKIEKYYGKKKKKVLVNVVKCQPKQPRKSQ